MQDFKDAIFVYETDLPDELKVVDGIAAEIRRLPLAAYTLVQVAHSLEEAAPQIDAFKTKACGSPYSLAIINLNMFQVDELNFILKPEILGDPQTIFLASLKYMIGDAYALARDKSLCESERTDRSPSCIDCYSALNRNSAFKRVCELAVAYLNETEARLEARRKGTISVVDAKRELKRSSTTMFGNALRSGLHSAIRSKPDMTQGKKGESGALWTAVKGEPVAQVLVKFRRDGWAQLGDDKDQLIVLRRDTTTITLMVKDGIVGMVTTQ